VLWSAASIAALAFSFSAIAKKENRKAAMLAALQSTLHFV
jgi:hypothetical protein